MEIAKYIGLFLLKNNFCYLPGLGNLEIKKSPASYDGQQLLPPQHTVSLSPTGSIDDNLANFIATNEQTSISKASNTLREFSIQSRLDLNEGKEVVIPAIGKFVSNGGKITFITDPNFQKTPPPVPAQQVVKKPEEPKKVTEAKPVKAYSGTTVNWGKIIIWILVLGVVVTAVIFAIRLIPSDNNNEAAATDTTKSVVTVQKDTTAKPPVNDSSAIKADSSAKHRDSLATVSPVSAGGMMQYKVLLNNYRSLSAAQKREKQLSSFGNHVELVTKDSSNFFVVMPFNGLASDTTRVLDSLRKKFNPKGVSIYR